MGRVYKDKILLQLLDVVLQYVHFFCQRVHAVLLSDRVKRHEIVGLFLELMMQRLPLFLECRDQFLTLVLGHQKLLAVFFVLLLDLHLTYQVVLVLDFVFNLAEVLGNLAVSLLLQVVLLFVHWKFGGSKNVLDCVCDDKVLVAD